MCRCRRERRRFFDDGRIQFAVGRFGGVQGLSILELGPLESGHPYMLQKAGAREIVAVEANTRAYLKCLIAKEVLGLEAAHFTLGDFEEYLRAPPRSASTRRSPAA